MHKFWLLLPTDLGPCVSQFLLSGLLRICGICQLPWNCHMASFHGSTPSEPHSSTFIHVEGDQLSQLVGRSDCL